MTSILHKFLAMATEDMAALVEDPDAHLHTARVNLASDTTYMAGTKDVSAPGKVKAVPDPEATIELLQKLWGLAGPYLRSTVKEWKE